MRTLAALALLLAAPIDRDAVPAYLVALSHGEERQRDWRLSTFEIVGDGLLRGRNNEVALALERAPQGLLADWPRGLVYLIEMPARGDAARLVAYAVDPSGFPFVFGTADLPGALDGGVSLSADGRYLATTRGTAGRCYRIEATTSLTATRVDGCKTVVASPALHARLDSYVYDWTPGRLSVRRTGGVARELLQEIPFPRDRVVVSLALLRPPD